MFNAPIDSPAEYIFIIVIKPKYETTINHDAKTMQSFYGGDIILR